MGAAMACTSDLGARFLTQTMRVDRISGAGAELVAPRLSGCASCATKAGCGTAVLNGQAAPLRVTVPDQRALRVGDEVTVAMPAGRFAGLAMLAYLLPPLAVAAVVGVMDQIGAPDFATIAAVLPVLGAAMVPLYLAERRAKGAPELQIIAVERPTGATP
ncbi:SoxR reducing system RseC family protein [Donghicola sp. C2-DW-16]|uniref:SoxR reducing system RseC family protein n=1 Tax=Donghicola mangrovi TaxID=2729614 RepID=A0ABX2PG93_9RHOB|nr:SoxR reducing system RseC family protein [Donghicola mangrovi]NVO28126.1 SoxR reducing system RseC family protein [Donghicola mangrovi]